MLKIIFSFCTVLFCAFQIFVTPVYSEDETSNIKLLIEKKIKPIDSALQDIADNSDIRKINLKIADIAFRKIIKKYPVILSIKRSSSKGLLINELFEESKVKKLFIDISENDWFRIPRQSLKSYYSPIIKKDKVNTVIWSKPVKVQKKIDEYIFGGIIAFTIDINRVLSDLEENFNKPVRCLYNKQVFFTYHWDDTKSFIEYPVEVNNIKLFDIQQVNNQNSLVIIPDGTSDKRSEKNDVKSIIHDSKPSQLLSHETPENKNNSDTIPELNISPSRMRGKFLFSFLLIFIIIGGLSFATVKFLLANGISSIIGSTFESREDDRIITETMNRYQQKFDEIDLIRSQVLDEVREEIDENITKSDIKEMLAQIRDNIRKKLYEKISNEEGNIIKEIVKNDLKDIFKNELKNTVYQQVINEFSDPLKEEFVIRLRKEIEENIKKSESKTGEIKQQCVLHLKERIADRVKQEYEQDFIDKAKKDLETKVNKTINESEIQRITHDIRKKVKNEIHKEISETEREKIRSKIEKKFVEELSVDIRKNEHESLSEQAREMVYREMYNNVVNNESENIREKVKEKFILQIREELNANQRDKIVRQEREIIRQDIVAILRNNEYSKIYEKERLILNEKVKQKIERDEYASIEEKQYTEISAEIRDKIRNNELDSISFEIRKEVSEILKKQIEENEKDELYASIRNELIQQIKQTIKNEEINTLKSQLLEEIVKKEKQRIYSHELSEIIYEEKKRIAEKEYENLKLEVLQQIHEKEMPGIIKRVKNDIYSDTIDQMKKELTNKLNKSMEKTLSVKVRELEKKMKSDFRKSLQEEYHYLIGIVRNMKTSLKGIEPVDSLRQTVLRLTEEKNKFRYFNLNTSQTVSLLEYLQRLQGNFDTYFQGLENTVTSIYTKVSDILNELGDDKTLL